MITATRRKPATKRTYQQAHEILHRQWWSMYMRGWDDALCNKRTNPYSRVDFRNAWEYGYKACMANEPLPGWYKEWNDHRRGRKPEDSLP